MKPLRCLIIALLALVPVLAHAQVVVKSPLSDDREAAPGEVYEGTVVVQNESDEPQQAKVYLTDYLFFADGSNRYDAPGTVTRSNAPWITFSPSFLTLAPGETVPVTYRVTVPAADDTTEGGPAGTFWSMLMVEGIAPGSAESTLGQAQNVPRYGVRQVTRYGIQLATHISGAGTPTIGFESIRLQAEEDGARVLEVDIQNEGDRLAESTMWVELYTSDGGAQGRRDGAAYRIYPGTSVRQRIDLSDLAPGAYEALIVVDAGNDHVVGAQYTLEL